MTRASSLSLLKITLYLLFLSAIGCSRQDPRDLSSVAWGSVPAIVDHSDRPLPSPWEYSIELEIGSDSGAEEYLLRSPFVMIVMPDNSIVIGDDKPLQLRVYNAHGSHVASFSQPGGGPGDLTPSHFGWVMRPVGERSFQLWSGWPPRMQEWTTSGELLTVETIAGSHPILLGTTPRTLGFSDEKLFWVTSSSRRDREGRDFITSHVLFGDIQGAAVDTLASIPHEPMPAMHQMILQFGLVDAVFLKDQVVKTKGNRLYIASWTEDWITEIDLSRGVPVSRFRWVHEPESITGTVDDKTTARFDEPGQEAFAEGLTWLRDRVSILGMAEGPDGQILVQRTSESIDDQWPTDVFSAEGRYLGRVMLPVEPRTAVVRGSNLYGLGTDQGIPVVRVLRIALPQ